MTSHPRTSRPWPDRRRRRTLTAGALALAALVGLTAGCGSTSTSSTTATTSTTAAPATTPATSAPAPTTAPAAAVAAAREVRTYTVDGQERRAIVHVPDIAAGATAPLVFVFHGHGGSGTTAERSFPVPTLWPDAIVVYPDGLVGHHGVTDPEGVKPGWQATPGELGDRDVHFFDAMLADLEDTLPVARDQVEVMGHSNGAQFSAVLWNQRGSELAAVAMSSAPVLRNIDGASPKPLFLSMGRSDTTAPFAAQQAGIAPAQQLLGVDVGAATTSGDLTTYPGPDGIELAVDIHDGGHDMPDSVLPEIVAFLQRHHLAAAP